MAEIIKTQEGNTKLPQHKERSKAITKAEP